MSWREGFKKTDISVDGSGIGGLFLALAGCCPCL
jgi:hypothetical protein